MTPALPVRAAESFGRSCYSVVSYQMNNVERVNTIKRHWYVTVALDIERRL